MGVDPQTGKVGMWEDGAGSNGIAGAGADGPGARHEFLGQEQKREPPRGEQRQARLWVPPEP